MLKVLWERKFPIDTLKALASARSAGKKLPFGDGEVVVEEATDQAFEGMDIVLGAAQNPLAGANRLARGFWTSCLAQPRIPWPSGLPRPS